VVDDNQPDHVEVLSLVELVAQKDAVLAVRRLEMLELAKLGPLKSLAKRSPQRLPVQDPVSTPAGVHQRTRRAATG
jgi:hypothetical protein